ncbi:MAG: Ger(x)C family spore germination protein [Paenibacillaceae bacterium]|nr:Ger(x)C family spore germination protein [Paenibacillaceae bacterium]
MRHAITALGAVIALLVLPGCWDRHELNNLSIVTGIGIDKSDRGAYRVTVQIVNPSQAASKEMPSGNNSPVLVYEESGATIPEALGRMTMKAPRQLLYSHVRVIVLGEDIAREGIGNPLDFIARNSALRTDFFLEVAHGTSAAKILQTYMMVDPIQANNLYTMLETSDRLWAATGKIRFDQLLDDLNTEGKNAALTGVSIIGKDAEIDNVQNGQHIKPRTALKFSGMAVFKHQHMVGWISEGETKALNYVQGSVSRSSAFLPCPNGGNVSLEVVNATSKIQAHVRDGKPTFDVYLRLEVDVAGMECDLDLSKTATLATIKQMGDEKLHDIVDSAIKRLQREFGTDIFGFGSVFHRRYPGLWRQIDDWDETFRTVPITVHANNIIRRTGTIVQRAANESMNKPNNPTK